MSVLRKARRIRTSILFRGLLQAAASTGLVAAALIGREEPLLLLVFSSAGAYVGYTAYRSFQLRAQFGAQAKAEAVLRNLIPDLKDAGFTFARQHRLPADCRDYLVAYPRSGKLAFVIGLSGAWPGRGSLEGPQRVATDLTAYGRPHVPVILAAFLGGSYEMDSYGVLAVTPERLVGALDDVELEFERALAEKLDRVREEHLEPALTAPQQQPARVEEEVG